MGRRYYDWSDIAGSELAPRNGRQQIVFKLSGTAAPPGFQQWMAEAGRARR